VCSTVRNIPVTVMTTVNGLLLLFLKPCPHCCGKVRLSQITATVAVLCDSLNFLRQYSRTFLRQCGQALGYGACQLNDFSVSHVKVMLIGSLCAC